MEEVFETIFLRKPSSKEKIILGRLKRLYGEEILKEAIIASISITEGSPVNYISTVAKNMAENSEITGNYSNLRIQTEKMLEQLKRYGTYRK